MANILETALEEIKISKMLVSALLDNKNHFSVEDDEGVECFIIYNNKKDVDTLTEKILNPNGKLILEEGCNEPNLIPILKSDLLIGKFRFKEKRHSLELTF